MKECETFYLLMPLFFFFYLKPLLLIHTVFLLNYTDYLYILIHVGSNKLNGEYSEATFDILQYMYSAN